MMLPKYSVKKPYTVLVGVILVLVLGIVSVSGMSTDLFPDISLPYVLVLTPYAGGTPEIVEENVTRPMESSMSTVSNIESVSSASYENFSMVTLEFSQNADMNSVSLEIREKIDQLEEDFDESTGTPVVLKIDPDILSVMIAAVNVDNMDDTEITAYVNDEIIPRLESLEGVASVSATGLLEESINVVISQDKIDDINVLILNSINEEFEEVLSQIEDGRLELTQSELLLSQERLAVYGEQLEINEGQSALNDSGETLDEDQSAAASALALTRQSLLTSKAELEASRTNLYANYSAASILYQNMNEIEVILGASSAYQNAYEGMTGTVVTGGDAGGTDYYKRAIDDLKSSLMGNSVLKEAADSDESIRAIVDELQNLDWSDSADHEKTASDLNTLTLALSADLLVQQGKIMVAFYSITGGMEYSDYVDEATETLSALEEKIALVDEGLAEADAGELMAAIELANANTSISLSDYQMQLAQIQLDSALSALDELSDELSDTLEQLEESEELLYQAMQEAYDSSDLGNILTADTVSTLLSAQNFSMPAGYVTEDGVSFVIRVGDKIDSVEELESLPILDLHLDSVGVITLGDVADICKSDNSGEIYATVNGSRGVILSVEKQSGYSDADVSRALKDRFDEMMSEDPDLEFVTLLDEGIYIDQIINTIVKNMLIGAALAFIILIFFLKDYRPTLVIACAIPISLVAALVCMYFCNITLNLISLSGLALGIGMLVDNSIVVIENIYRMRTEGKSVEESAVLGAGEVMGAIIASTLTTVCVFLPIVFTEGITRQLFADMGLTIAFLLLSSLIVSLTVVPALGSRILGGSRERKQGKISGTLSKVFEKLLTAALRFKPVVFIVVIVLFAVSLLMALSRGTAFMPQMDSTQMSISVQLDETAQMEDTVAVTEEIVDILMDLDDVEDVGAMMGGNVLVVLIGGSSEGGLVNNSIVYAVTKENKSMTNDEIKELILEGTSDIDADITVDTSMMNMSAFGESGINIQVRGKNMDDLARTATEVAAVVESVEGTAEVSDGLEKSGEEIRVIVDREKAISYGLTVAQVYIQVAGELSDGELSTVLETSDSDLDVYVMSGNDTEITVRSLRELEIAGTDEEGNTVTVPLEKIADFEEGITSSVINREDQTRYIAVTAQIADGYNVGLVSTAVERKLADYELPDGVELVYEGENETINDSIGQVIFILALALVLMYLIMVAQFQSFSLPFIIMFTIPMAFTGGFFALFICGCEISVVSLIGFVMLAGVIVNNGIVLIDYMNRLQESGMEKRDAIYSAVRTRLRPVLMTALTTILAMSAMIFSKDMGAEMSRPMALVTVGGLLYGTILTLVVVPCIYDLMPYGRGRKKSDKLQEEYDGQSKTDIRGEEGTVRGKGEGA